MGCSYAFHDAGFRKVRNTNFRVKVKGNFSSFIPIVERVIIQRLESFSFGQIDVPFFSLSKLLQPDVVVRALPIPVLITASALARRRY